MTSKEEKSYLPPTGVEYGSDYLRLNSFYHRVIVASGYPRVVEDGWLDKIITTKGQMDLAMHIQPMDIAFMLTALNRELVKQKSDLVSAKSKGMINPSLAIQQSDTHSMLIKLQSGRERLFDFSLAINARARSKNELDFLSAQINSHLNGMMILPKKPVFQMLLAIKQLLPLLSKTHFPARNMPSSVLSACFPFTTRYLDQNPKGVLMGVQSANKVPLLLDPFSFPNHNGLIVGSSGSGKSFFIKLHIIRQFMAQTKTIVIDPQNEYTPLVLALGGTVHCVKPRSPFAFNPFDLGGQSLLEKLDGLDAFFALLLGGFPNTLRSELRQFIQEFYQHHHLVLEKPATWKKESPKMAHFHSFVQKRKEKKVNDGLGSILDEITNRLVDASPESLQMDWSSPLISFDLSAIPNRVRAAYMFLVLDLIRYQFPVNKENRLVVMDEAWSVLSHDAASEIIFEMVKTARKFHWGVVLITQEANDLLHNSAGKTVLANTAWKVLFRQESSVIQGITEQFHLTESQAHFLLTVPTGCGLLITPVQKVGIEVIASNMEKEIMAGKV